MRRRPAFARWHGVAVVAVACSALGGHLVGHAFTSTLNVGPSAFLQKTHIITVPYAEVEPAQCDGQANAINGEKDQSTGTEYPAGLSNTANVLVLYNAGGFNSGQGFDCVVPGAGTFTIHIPNNAGSTTCFSGPGTVTYSPVTQCSSTPAPPYISGVRSPF